MLLAYYCMPAPDCIIIIIIIINLLAEGALRPHAGLSEAYKRGCIKTQRI